jgi:hypothetical protein
MKAPNQTAKRTEIQQWSPKNVYLAVGHSAAAYLNVIAPRQAWRFLQGESPCRARASHPPVSSLASVAESAVVAGEQDRRSVDRESCRP